MPYEGKSFRSANTNEQYITNEYWNYVQIKMNGIAKYIQRIEKDTGTWMK